MELCPSAGVKWLIRYYRAGVIGLQSAIALLEAGYKVTVIGKHLPGDLSTDYTSPW
jgi:hypothetical protein